MRKREKIEMEMIWNKKILIEDEKKKELEVKIKEKIMEIMKKIKRERGMGMLLVKNNMGVVEEIEKRVVVMYEGRIVERGKVKEVLRNKRNK